MKVDQNGAYLTLMGQDFTLDPRQCQKLRDLLLVQWPITPPVSAPAAPEPVEPAAGKYVACDARWNGRLSQHRCSVRVLPGQPHASAHVCGCGVSSPQQHHAGAS